jgi:ABC-type multidrug transport system ATPase subunit
LALTITGLSKTYPNGVKALKNLSLTIGNLMFGLLGPNGAGKSSLIGVSSDFEPVPSKQQFQL